MGIKIPKSDKTIKKEERKSKIEVLKKKSNVTNSDIKDLLLDILEILDK